MAEPHSDAVDGGRGESSTAPLFDLHVALQRMDGDPELLREIIDIFLEDHVDCLRELRSAAEARDVERLQRSAHTIKGAAGNFVACRVTALALEIETQCKASQLAQALSQVGGLEREIVALAAALRLERHKEEAA